MSSLPKILKNSNSNVIWTVVLTFTLIAVNFNTSANYVVYRDFWFVTSSLTIGYQSSVPEKHFGFELINVISNLQRYLSSACSIFIQFVSCRTWTSLTAVSWCTFGLLLTMNLASCPNLVSEPYSFLWSRFEVGGAWNQFGMWRFNWLFDPSQWRTLQIVEKGWSSSTGSQSLP